MADRGERFIWPRNWDFVAFWLLQRLKSNLKPKSPDLSELFFSFYFFFPAGTGDFKFCQMADSQSMVVGEVRGFCLLSNKSRFRQLTFEHFGDNAGGSCGNSNKKNIQKTISRILFAGY